MLKIATDKCLSQPIFRSVLFACGRVRRRQLVRFWTEFTNNIFVILNAATRFKKTNYTVGEEMTRGEMWQ